MVGELLEAFRRKEDTKQAKSQQIACCSSNPLQSLYIKSNSVNLREMCTCSIPHRNSHVFDDQNYHNSPWKTEGDRQEIPNVQYIHHSSSTTSKLRSNG